MSKVKVICVQMCEYNDGGGINFDCSLVLLASVCLSVCFSVRLFVQTLKNCDQKLMQFRVNVL